MGNLYFFQRLVIDYGYWLDLLTFSLENSRAICFLNELRFILLQNIVDIIVFSLLQGARYTITKSIGTSNVQILPFFSKSNSVMGNFAHNSENYLLFY